jgi:hypothetical protein
MIRYAAGVAGALLVLVIGKWVAMRQARQKPAEAITSS